MKQKIVFFGSGDYSISVIEMLKSLGLELVITTETQGPLIEYLKTNSIQFESTKVTGDKKISKQELWNKVKNLKPTLGVLASFGAIIPQDVIDLFPHGIWNIHPSLLPKFKGPSPIQATILSDEIETGVTIIKLDDQVDHGPILAQEKIQLDGSETSQLLKHELFKKGGEMIVDLINILSKGEIKITEQDHSKETWTEKITKDHGKIDLENPPSPELLDKMIRAYYPWPTVWGYWKTKNGKIKLVKLLPDKKIQVEGKKVMSFKDFKNGYQEEGTKLLNELNLAE